MISIFIILKSEILFILLRQCKPTRPMVQALVKMFIAVCLNLIQTIVSIWVFVRGMLLLTICVLLLRQTENFNAVVVVREGLTI